MRAGELRKRFTIQTADEQQSPTGDISLAWRNESKVWGKLEPVSGGESITAEQRIADTNFLITIRYWETISTRKRLKLGDRFFEIQSVLNVDERNRQMTLGCKETR